MYLGQRECVERLTSIRAISNLLIERLVCIVVESLIIGVVLTEPRRRHRSERVSLPRRPANARPHWLYCARSLNVGALLLMGPGNPGISSLLSMCWCARTIPLTPTARRPKRAGVYTQTCDTLHAIVCQREMHRRYLQTNRACARPCLERESEKKVQSVDPHLSHGSRLVTPLRLPSDTYLGLFSINCYNQVMEILQ